jgi:hypothetical protein
VAALLIGFDSGPFIDSVNVLAIAPVFVTVTGATSELTVAPYSTARASKPVWEMPIVAAVTVVLALERLLHSALAVPVPARIRKSEIPNATMARLRVMPLPTKATRLTRWARLPEGRALRWVLTGYAPAWP